MPLSRSEQHALVAKHQRLAAWVAWRYARAVPGALPWVDDLVQEALIGFAEAAARYDPATGVLFTTFAVDCAKNTVRNALRRFLKSEAEEPAAQATDEDGEPQEPEYASPWASPYEELEAAELRRIVRDSVSDLAFLLGKHGARDASIFWRHLAEQETAPALAAEFGLTPTRVLQIVAKARPVFVGRLLIRGYDGGQQREMKRVRKVAAAAHEEIRHLYAAGGVTQYELADRYQCSQTQIARLLQRRTRG